MSELFQASQAASVADPAPALGLQFLPHRIRHPVVALTAALPGCFIYLFCTNRVAAGSFWFKKREEEGKKKRKKMLPGSFLSLGLGSAAAVAAATTAVLPAG